MTSFITSRPVCVYSCSQLRELWFNDLFMYMYMIVHVGGASTCMITFTYYRDVLTQFTLNCMTDIHNHVHVHLYMHDGCLNKTLVHVQVCMTDILITMYMYITWRMLTSGNILALHSSNVSRCQVGLHCHLSFLWATVWDVGQLLCLQCVWGLPSQSHCSWQTTRCYMYIHLHVHVHVQCHVS